MRSYFKDLALKMYKSYQQSTFLLSARQFFFQLENSNWNSIRRDDTYVKLGRLAWRQFGGYPRVCIIIRFNDFACEADGEDSWLLPLFLRGIKRHQRYQIRFKFPKSVNKAIELASMLENIQQVNNRVYFL